jgi:hypothetical protein
MFDTLLVSYTRSNAGGASSVGEEARIEGEWDGGGGRETERELLGVADTTADCRSASVEGRGLSRLC